MSYMKKGLRQSIRKNVLERGFKTKDKFYKISLESMSTSERRMETKGNYKRNIKNMRSNYLNFGSRIRNTQLIHPNGSRNYKNCMDLTGKFIRFNGDEWNKMTRYELVDLNKVQSLKIFEKYGDKDRLFHLTSPKNWDKIRNYGLISRHKNHNYPGCENQIYLVSSSHKDVLNQIGYGQITTGFEVPMVVLEIDKKGITGELFGEEGGEYTSPFHTVLVNQKRILPKYIKYHTTFTTNEKRYFESREEFGEGKTEFYKNTQGIERDQIKLMGVDEDTDHIKGSILQGKGIQKLKGFSKGIGKVKSIRKRELQKVS